MTTLSGIKLEILSTFFPRLGELTTKQIEEELPYSHGTVFKNLKELVEENYLEEKKVGKTNLYRLSTGEDLFFIFNFYMSERKKELKEKHPLLYKRLNEFSNKIEKRSLILFGSYAKREETEDSDVDLLCVSNEEGIEEIASSFKTKYNLNINPLVVSPEDFGNIEQENKQFYHDLRNYGIVLDGLEFFFREVYRDEIA